MKNLIQIMVKYKVGLCYLFGSQRDIGIDFVNGKEITITKSSDLDIGILFNSYPENSMEIYGSLYLDLSFVFEPFEIDLIFLNKANTFLQYEAIKGYLLYCTNEFIREEFEEMILKKASDLSYKRKEFEKDFLEAIRDGYFEIKLR